MQRHDQPEWEQHGQPEEDAPKVPLTPHQRTRMTQAAADLDEARRADLTQLDAAGLIRMVEQLRGSLDDLVELLRGLDT